MKVGGLAIVREFGGVGSKNWAGAGCATNATGRESAASSATCFKVMTNLTSTQSTSGWQGKFQRSSGLNGNVNRLDGPQLRGFFVSRRAAPQATCQGCDSTCRDKALPMYE